MNRLLILGMVIVLMASCERNSDSSDAYGNFEATTTIVSSETKGRLIRLDIEEGDNLEAGTLIAVVDTVTLHLQRRQIEATIGTLPKKLRNTIADIEVLEKQKVNLLRERDRVEKLLEKKAATPKQLDDLNGQIDVVNSKIEAVRSNTGTGNLGILAEKEPLLAQKAIIDEQIRRSYIRNPVSGTVLAKLMEEHEFVGMGTPLYRIGQLDTMTLRFYVDAVQLQGIRLGQQIEVLIDDGKEGYRHLKGYVSWISGQAEFTPKTIQTKKDRVNLVYAVKAIVANPDGLLKIGMPAEVNFNSSETNEPN